MNKKTKGLLSIVVGLLFMALYFIILTGPLQTHFIDAGAAPNWLFVIASSVISSALIAYFTYAGFINVVNSDTGNTEKIDTSPKRVLRINTFLIWWLVWAALIFLFSLMWVAEL